MTKTSILLAAALIFGAAIAVPAAAQTPTFVTLGTTGGPIPNPQRSQPANAVVIGNDVLLLDSGDGAAERIVAAGIRLDQVRAVFLSHLHLDHTAGLAGIIGLRWMNAFPGTFRVYGPFGTRALVAGITASMEPARRAGYGLNNGFGTHPVIVEVVELRDGETVAPIPGAHMSIVENSHYTFPAVAGVERGASLSFKLEAGGRSIVYTGDTGPSDAVIRLAKGADLLVSEVQDYDALTSIIRKQAPGMQAAAYANLIEHLRRHHLSAEDVGRIAKAAGVGRVVLTHLAPAPGQREAEAMFLPGVHKFYAGPVVVAQDLSRY